MCTRGLPADRMNTRLGQHGFRDRERVVGTRREGVLGSESVSYAGYHETCCVGEGLEPGVLRVMAAEAPAAAVQVQIVTARRSRGRETSNRNAGDHQVFG